MKLKAGDRPIHVQQQGIHTFRLAWAGLTFEIMRGELSELATAITKTLEQDSL